MSLNYSEQRSEKSMLFRKMHISKATIEDLEKYGFKEPTPIQEKAIPVIMEKADHVIAQAKTGTGKTLAFSIPIVEKLDPKSKRIQAVILVPTRELCKQVSSMLVQISRRHGFETVEVYGGVGINPQINKVEQGAQIIIATPGRFIDLYKRKVLDLRYVKFIVLDEADRMLDMGFFPDISFIIKAIMHKADPRILLFSATMLERVKRLIQKAARNRKITEIDVSRDSLTVDSVKQFYYRVPERKAKYNAFVKILKYEKPQYSIVFVNTKKMARILTEKLQRDKRVKVKVAALHGDMTQNQREEVMKLFRKKIVNFIVATDVAARGLDFYNLTHVFNYDLPQNAEDYVHRIGRTARMDADGTAISLIEDTQFKILDRIEAFMKREIVQRALSTHKPYSNTEEIGPKYAIINY